MATDPVNPFDNENGTFLVLRNDAGQHSLWPDFLAVPSGWSVVHGPGPRAACLERIDSIWNCTPLAANG